MNNNNYNAGVPPSNAHTTAPLSTRIESHIPGTQAHREREYLQHEDQTTLRGTQMPPTGSNMNTHAPTYNRDVPPTGGVVGSGYNHGGIAPVTGAPTTKHGATMSERVAELHGDRAPHTGSMAPVTGHAGSGTGTKPHMGDKVMGGVEAAIGRAANDPVMEQKGWERKTFGDPKHRTDGVAHGGMSQQQQGYAPTGTAAQQGFNNPQAGYAPPTHPPTGY